MSESIQIISSVGFPIFMCLVLIKLMKESEHQNNKVIDDLRNTINKNTIILTKIYERLGDDNNG